MTAGASSRISSAVAAKLEQLDALDVLVEPIQAAVRAAIPEESSLKELLSGTWLGHPLHPLLTDAVVGSWLCAALLDLLGSEDRERAADDLVAAGLVAALPTVLTGLSDWAELRSGPRRVGAVHAAGNGVAFFLQAGSWLARRGGNRRVGQRLSLVAMTAAGFSAWLGGHLSFGEGVGVDQTVFEDLPSSWVPLLDEDRLEDGVPVRRSARGTGVLVLRHEGTVHALVDRCSHRGCSLSDGSFDGTAITCPCHGSRFGLDGRVLRGPATGPQPVLETRVRNAKVEVRGPE